MNGGLVGLVVLLLLLAGCADEAPADDVAIAPGDAGDAPGLDVLSGAVAPAWDVGDFWMYDTNFGTTNTLVVTAKDGSSYTTDTDSEDTAFYHAREEISTIGTIRASDLAGEQDGQKVQYFDFPLEHDKRWPATLDGEAYEVVAHEMNDGTWHMLMQQDGTTRVEYGYDAEVKWFTFIQYNDENGEMGYRMDLSASGEDFAGEIVRIGLDAMIDFSSDGPDAVLVDVPTPTADDVYLMANMTCTTAVQQFAVGPVSSAPSLVTQTESQGMAFQNQCPTGVEWAGVVAEAPYEENWAYTYQAPDAEAHLDFVLYGRTIERIAVGA